MRSTIINKHSDRSFDLVIDGSSLYDLTVDYNLNDIDMSSIYNKNLSSHCLVVDADVSGKTFNYIKRVEDYSDVASLTPPTSGFTQSNYFQYQWAVPSGYTMFEDRMELGWTAEFITDFDTTLTASTNNILFYMGKIENLSGQTGELLNNNFVVTIKNRQLLFKQISWERSCNCETAVDLETSVTNKSQLTLPTGTTLHHLVLVFQRDLSLTEEDLKVKGANLECDGLPNNHWYDGKKYRMGALKIYLDGLLRDTIIMEEVIFRDTVDDLPQVQGWGLGDDPSYQLSNNWGLSGSYLGNLVRGRFYECPLRGDEIRINFELFATQYNMTNILTSC
jgi:hypothetical protein